MQPRTYQSWASPAKHVVPEWAREPAAWERAFEVLEQDPPPYDGTFLHRDFAPRNVLWTGPDVTGVVDWVETSWGPPWLDVAHFRTNLVLTHGTEVADRFAATYARLTGREPQPYFDVMDVVGLLPAPGPRCRSSPTRPATTSGGAPGDGAVTLWQAAAAAASTASTAYGVARRA